MAATITDGLSSMAKSDLSGLRQRIDKLREEAERKLQEAAESPSAHRALLTALQRAKRVSM